MSSEQAVLSPLKPLRPSRPHEATVGSENGAAGGASQQVTAAAGRSNADFINRTLFTIIMAYVFLVLVAFGAEVIIPFLLLLSVAMTHEVTRISQNPRKDRQLMFFHHLMKWWFLGINLFLSNMYHVRHALKETFPSAEIFYNSFGFIAFGLNVSGVVAFVLSLRKGMYRYQFVQFTWTCMALAIILFQASLQVSNMMRAMLWFLLPVSCVINNDIWAYAFGKMFGRTRLLALSPKKTVEGFIGAFLFTMIWGFWFSGFLSSFPQLYCPKEKFFTPISCEPDPLFIFRDTPLPDFIVKLSGGYFRTIYAAPVQWHTLVLAAFASLLAPFGGFFASGLKRAFKLKDFGDLIPGHGGITDRMDCQGMMGFFTYVYLSSFVYANPRCPSTATVERCVMSLGLEQRRRLAEKLLESLAPK